MDKPAEPLPATSPIELQSPRARSALSDAAIWLGLAAALWLAWRLAEPILVIVAGLIFAAGLQGGAEGLKRFMPGAGHGLRLTIVVLLFFAVFAGFLAFAGVQIAAEFGELGKTLQQQAGELSEFAVSLGIDFGGDPVSALKEQLGKSLGRITTVLSTALGGLSTVFLILLLGIFFAADARGYERGVEWLTPARYRNDVRDTVGAIAAMLRRWVLGRFAIMLIEGVLIYVGLLVVGVPLAGVLGLIAGLLAFIPTLGALISGALIVLVGLSAGIETALLGFGVFLAVSFVDNFLNPVIEKKAVDIAPAVVLAAQLLFGTLFGVLGVALADPLVAMAKVALERPKAAKPARSDA